MSQNLTNVTFVQRLAQYKQQIDTGISAYTKELEKQTLSNYGAYARLELDAYLSILARGGKRIRGSLVLAGYEMVGGIDTEMVLRAARAVEMIHAYILIVDDFQDRSHVRRGGPAAHTLLQRYHARHELGGDGSHFGASIALNAALAGAHLAQQVILDLPVDAARKVRISKMLNETMVTTAHGQTIDIMNEVVADVSADDIDKVLEWKTAHYTFLNPISIGMVLGGATDEQLASVRKYALHAGRAFQITDDILGTFGTEFESGKSPMDDIREGKRTVITAYALEHTNDDNKNFLVQMLGNSQLNPVEFERCKDILVASGALAFAQRAAQRHIQDAVAALDARELGGNATFLKELALSLVDRTA